MRVREFLFATSGLFGIALAALPAWADSPAATPSPTAPITMSWNQFYAGVTAGAVIPDSISAHYSGIITGSGNLNLDTGAAGGGFAGYHINDYIAGEAELDYVSFDLHSTSGNFDSKPFTIGESGTLDTVIGFANAIVTPLGRSSHFTPYLGGGLGFADTTDSVSSLTLGRDVINVNTSSNETDFAADAIVGFDYAVTDNISLGARYRFIWINSATSNNSGGINTSTGNLTANMLMAEASYRF